MPALFALSAFSAFSCGCFCNQLSGFGFLSDFGLREFGFMLKLIGSGALGVFLLALNFFLEDFCPALDYMHSKACGEVTECERRAGSLEAVNGRFYPAYARD